MPNWYELFVGIIFILIGAGLAEFLKSYLLLLISFVGLLLVINSEYDIPIVRDIVEYFISLADQ
jgi:hypothetical protein